MYLESLLPALFFFGFSLFSFFLSVVDKQTKQNKNRKIYTSNGEHRLKIFGGITKVIKSYGGISSVKYHLKGGVSHILPR